MTEKKEERVRDRVRYICCAAGVVLACLVTGCGKTEENLDIAMQKIQELDYQGALEDLAKAQEAGENVRLVNRARGIAHMGLTEYEEAITDFQAALAGSSGLVENVDFDLNYYLAAAYTKNGQYGQAEDTYNAILDLRPGEADAYFLRGNVRMSLENFEGAKEDFDKVLAMEPKNYDRLIQIYEVLEHFGYREVGQGYLQNALASGGGQMDAYVSGRIYYYLGEYQKAYLALEEAKEKGGEKSYLYLGRAYEATGDYNYASSVYNSYLSKYDGSAEIYNQLGLCELAKGEYQKALEAFQAGMQLENSGMMQTLSFNEIITYEYLGDFERAKALMDYYVKNYPDDGQARREYDFLVTR